MGEKYDFLIAQNLTKSLKDADTFMNKLPMLYYHKKDKHVLCPR